MTTAKKEDLEALIEQEGLEPVVPEPPKSTGVNDDMLAAAAADLKEKNKKREADSKIRTFKRGGGARELYVSELFPFPERFDTSNLSPTSYLAQMEGEITGSVDTQKYSIIEARLKGLLFEAPGRPLEGGRSLRTVKWLKPDGTLVQVPFEGQINNTAAGDIADAIGVRKFERKGGVVFFNFESSMPIYCFARNCHAPAMIEQLAGAYPKHVAVIGSGYCSREHFMHTEPNRARQWFREGGSMFEVGATTSGNAKR